MSKPDKFGETFDRESREDVVQSKNRSSQGSADENLDDLESSEELLGGRAGMGKEIKLGLAVIVVLLIVLGVVVVRRLMRPGTETASGGMEGAGAAEKQGPAAKGFQSSPSPAKTAKSTVASPLSGTSGPAAKRWSPDLDSGKGTPNRFAGFDGGADPFGDRVPPASGGWGGGAAPASAPGSRRAMDEPPRPQRPATEPPAGRSPFGPSAGSFGSAPGNRIIEDESRPGASRSGTSPREILPPTRPVEFSSTTGIRTPQTLGPAGVADDLAGRGGAMGKTDGGALRRPDGTYVVQPNDSFWTISDNLYGTGAYYEALLKHNRSKYSRADQIRWGDVISAPSAEELARLYPDFCPKPAHREAMAERGGVRGTAAAPPGTRTYVVQNGDTIYDIARSELGSATRWNEVYQLNRETLGKHPEYITPGMRLVLPGDSGSPGVLTRRPGSGYMR